MSQKHNDRYLETRYLIEQRIISILKKEREERYSKMMENIKRLVVEEEKNKVYTWQEHLDMIVITAINREARILGKKMEK